MRRIRVRPNTGTSTSKYASPPRRSGRRCARSRLMNAMAQSANSPNTRVRAWLGIAAAMSAMKPD